MSRLARVPGVVLGILGLVLIGERPVHAYIDPGSGSLIYQTLLAGALALGFGFRRIIGAVRQFMGRTRPPHGPTDSASRE